jgi:hypothetical protein
MVPHKYEQDKSLGQWVDKQRRNHVKNKMRLDRKSLLDKIGFVWKVANRSSPRFCHRCKSSCHWIVSPPFEKVVLCSLSLFFCLT